MRRITSADQKSRKSVDYVSVQLIYDYFQLVRSILVSAIPTILEQQELVTTSTQVKNFIKVKCASHSLALET